LDKKNQILDIEPLFKSIKPIHEEYHIKEAFEESVEDSKKLQKTYNWDRAEAREQHWKNLKQKYFDEDEDGKLKPKADAHCEGWYVTFVPADGHENPNAWRQYKFFNISFCCVSKRFYITWQMLLVIIAIITGVYSYLYIARDIETQVAVQEGVKVLEDVTLEACIAFAIYNIVVLIYYWRSCWNSIVSGLYYTIFALRCGCLRASENTCLETVFKPTWTMKD